jgi:hypothetical protein
MKTRLLNVLRGRPRPTSGAPVPDDAVAHDADLKKLPPLEQKVVDAALPNSITSVPRLLAVVNAVRYCERRGISGAFAECGVWRGGSVLAMILTLQDMGAERDIWLYDTFEGMTEPTDEDTSEFHRPALETWQETEAGPAWPEYFSPEVFNEEGVRKTLLSTGYPEARLHFVRGPVEETIPGTIPDSLALLRLDTDWYESTRHELVHLYPLLADAGVLIIDDYGHWEGCRRAVDEYFDSEAPPILLNRVDYSGRLAIKH